jgi:hypothetical protein
MKRSMLQGLGLASAVLSLGLAGCGSDGVETGVPTDSTQKGVPLDPAFLDMKGRMGAGAAKTADVKASQAKKEAGANGEASAEAEKK